MHQAPQPDQGLGKSVACGLHDRVRSMQAVAEQSGLELAVPPPKLCTDNGVMVAWAGVERMRLGLWEHLPAHAAGADEAEWVDVRPRWPLTDRWGPFTSILPQ